MKSLQLLTLAFLCLLPVLGQAKIITEEVKYKVDEQEFSGYIAYDDSKGKRPGVLIVHEWWGNNAYARRRALMLAEAGYTAFALDMYGTGKVASHPSDANTFMMQVFSNMPAAEKRFDKAYDLLNRHAFTQKDHIAAIGYCFGGAIVLHMARLGKPLEAVASFHGNLASNLPKEKKPLVKGLVAVFTGSADSMIPATQVAAFTQEMFEAGANVSVQVYPGVLHSFTNPDADSLGKEFNMPLAYNVDADKDSWKKTLALFDRAFQ